MHLSGTREEDLTRLIRLQGEKLGVLSHRVEAYNVELRTFKERGECGGGCDAAVMAAVAEEITCMDKRLRRNEVEMAEEEFWMSELDIERESERQLDERLQEMRGRVRDCEDKLKQRLTRQQGMEAGLEAERVQMEQKEIQQVWETHNKHCNY